VDDSWEGFTWLNAEDAANSVLAFIRHSGGARRTHVVCVINFTPVIRRGYAVPMPGKGTLGCILNSDETIYGGSGVPAVPEAVTIKNNYLGKPYIAVLTLPPLSAIYYEFTSDEEGGSVCSLEKNALL